MTYQIQLPVFEGPFDLLLFFIERDELDIYDIPISRITRDYLDYLQQPEQLDMEAASEFIWMAATLMRIKAKMLLPRPPVDESGQPVDPRQELIEQLLAYQRYKPLFEALRQREGDMQLRAGRGHFQIDWKRLAARDTVDAELQNLQLGQLLRAYERVRRRWAERNARLTSIKAYPYTVGGQKKYLLERVAQQKRVAFVELMEDCDNRVQLMFSFLAILELLQVGELGIDLPAQPVFNEFWIYAN